jgi:3-oxoacyl-[acyl-carrier protein] reductase
MLAMDFGLHDRVCVVTGASRGIGRELSRQLAAEGARVVMVSRSENELAEAAGEIGAEWIATDVTAPDAAQRIVACAAEQLGRLDVLVNNAGTSFARSPDELTDEDWQGQWELHVMASMRLMRAAAPWMAEAGWGRIVNVASSAGKRPSLTNVAYAVTKSAQLSLSRAWADLYAGDGVLVNAVAPGPVGSDLWLAPGGLADQTAEAKGISRDEALAAQQDKVPLGRFARPEEIANVCLFLCSELASTVTGAAWSADGGTVATIV